jgi:hypothetical protein
MSRVNSDDYRMTKMSLMGVDKSGLIDCTSALPPPKEGMSTSAPGPGPSGPSGSFPSGFPFGPGGGKGGGGGGRPGGAPHRRFARSYHGEVNSK